ncbi:MAG TPA: PaaI family thioesterase [Acidimicrobiales bacterium]|nr:PaaI family thioesterase [Acidimicrobiales bacterium]
MQRPAIESFDPAIAQAMLDPHFNGSNAFTDFLGLRIVEVTPGRATAEIEVRPDLLQAFGAVHGGVMAALVDHVLGSAIFPSVPTGTWPATLEFKLNYLAPVRQGTLRATGEVIALRKRTAVVQVEVTNDGQPVAAAQGTISLHPPKA